MDINNKSNCPTLKEIGQYIGNPLFDKFCSVVMDEYGCVEKIEFSSCSWEAGWNVKFKKSGKTLCTIYPKKSYFTVMVVIGQKEKPLAELLLPSLSPELQDIYRNTKEGNGQKWLMIDLKNEGETYAGTLRLVRLRKDSRQHF